MNRLTLLVLAASLVGCGGSEPDHRETAEARRVKNVTAPAPTIVSWVAPTTNDDGSALVDLAGYKLSYGTAPGVYTTTVDIKDPAAVTYTLTNLTPATYYFSVAAYNIELNSSVNSIEVSKIVK